MSDHSDVFWATDEYKYWFADEYGISNALAPPAYEAMGIEQAKQVRDELDEVIEIYEDSKDE
jgi:hypothetical protein